VTVDVEDKDQDLQEQEDAEKASKKGKKSPGFLTKIILVVVVLIFQISVAYFGVNYLFFGEVSSEISKPVEESGYEEVGPIIQLDELVVNPSGSLGRRFVVVKVALELLDIAVQEDLEHQMPLINDGLIRLLASKNVEYLSNVAARDSLREEMRVVINDRLPNNDGVTNVFFTGFVLQ
jgi:flagellar basal body-associated protein FliL